MHRSESTADADVNRSLYTLAKNNNGLWKSEGQYRHFVTAAKQARLISYYSDDSDEPTHLTPDEYADREGVALDDGQFLIVTSARYSFISQHTGDYTHRNSRHVGTAWVLDGQGIVARRKITFHHGHGADFGKVKGITEEWTRSAEGTDQAQAAADADAKRQAERAADDANKTAAPTGRVTITGTVVARTERDTDYGITIKLMLRVETDAGWYKVWVTEPGNLPISERGDSITMKVTLTRSDDDEAMAFGKRPAKAVNATADARETEVAMA